jgi:hypothetical protein
MQPQQLVVQVVQEFLIHLSDQLHFMAAVVVVEKEVQLVLPVRQAVVVAERVA